MPTDTRLLQVDGLSVSFRHGAHAVRDITFNIGQERVGVVGESGSGKTMTGRAIMRLEPKGARLTARRLAFLGQDLLAMPERKLSRLRGGSLALIMQDPRYSLNPVRPVGRQIAEAAALHLGLGRSAATRAATDALAAVRIRDPGHVATLYPHQVSGGMGQRIMIAMMLLARPRLVIADEPTSALDVSVRKDIMRLLDELVRDNRSGLMLISHDIRLVAHFCDRILVMLQGRIVEEFTTLADARHPYTRALIEGLPSLDGPRRRRLAEPDRAALAAMAAP